MRGEEAFNCLDGQVKDTDEHDFFFIVRASIPGNDSFQKQPRMFPDLPATLSNAMHSQRETANESLVTQLAAMNHPTNIVFGTQPHFFSSGKFLCIHFMLGINIVANGECFINNSPQHSYWTWYCLPLLPYELYCFLVPMHS